MKFYTFVLQLFLFSSLCALPLEEFPQNCDEAYFLYKAGDINTDHYNQFVKLLLNPVDIWKDGVVELRLLGGSCALPDYDDIQSFRRFGPQSKDTLLAVYPQLGYYDPYIDWKGVSETVRGSVRSAVFVDSGNASAQMGLNLYVDEHFIFKGNISCADSSVAVEERSMRASWHPVAVTLGTLRPTIGPFAVRPVAKHDVPDSLSICYGNGHYLNGFQSRAVFANFYLDGVLSLLENEHAVLGRGVYRAKSYEFSVLAYGVESDSGSAVVLGGEYKMTPTRLEALLLYAYDTRDLCFAVGLRGSQGRWRKHFNFKYASAPRAFHGIILFPSISRKLQRHIFNGELGTVFNGREVSYKVTTLFFQSAHCFSMRFSTQLFIKSLVTQRYSLVVKGEKEYGEALGTLSQLKGEWRALLFSGKGSVRWRSSLFWEKDKVDKLQLFCANQWRFSEMLYLEGGYAHTLNSGGISDHEVVVTIKINSGSIGRFGITARTDCEDLVASQVKLFSTLQF